MAVAIANRRAPPTPQNHARASNHSYAYTRLIYFSMNEALAVPDFMPLTEVGFQNSTGIILSPVIMVCREGLGREDLVAVINESRLVKRHAAPHHQLIGLIELELVILARVVRLIDRISVQTR